MTSVAVVAHRGKSLGGGLDELRSELAHAGVEGLLWFEVPKSRKAPKQVAKAVAAGADLVFVWGGDGMVQRCADALAGKPRHDRHRARRYGQPPGDEPGHPERHRWCRQRWAEWSPPEARPRRDQRRTLRRHGRSGIRRR